MEIATYKNLSKANQSLEFFYKKNSNDEYLSHKAYMDLAFVALASLIFLFFSVTFDFYEKLYEWSRQYDLFEVDEIIVATLVFFPGLIWFALRRWQEAALAFKKSNEACIELEKTQNHLQKLLSENRSLMKRLDKVQEEERQRIAVDLHDIFGQHLTAIHANASTLQLKLSGYEDLQKLTQKISSSSEQLSQLTRLMFNELRPPVLENIGLTAALKNYIAIWLENHHEFNIHFKSDGSDKKIPINKGLILYRALQEALTNIAKHSSAKNIKIHIKYGEKNSGIIESFTILEIDDDGVGFDNTKQTNGLGLVGMRERVLNTSGEFKVNSNNQTGTSLWIKIPEQHHE